MEKTIVNARENGIGNPIYLGYSFSYRCYHTYFTNQNEDAMPKIDIRHFHLFAGLGGGAKGFNEGEARVGNLEASFRCLGGIDVDHGAMRDFNKLAGVPGTVLDLFDRAQYVAFHGHQPPKTWREATRADIHAAANNEAPDIVFLSAPCKGFSGLLAEGKSRTDKYQALNRLTVRGVWLMLEAFSDDPPSLIVFENVPRIASRGRFLLDQIVQLLAQYGYAVAETTHDCGELGGLAQSRKRFLLVARHIEKVPPFLYEPRKKSLQAVGTVLGRMPLPGDLTAGPMHRIPTLQWKTWVRLAFVEAGSDWRSLNKLAVENSHLRDYLLVREMHNGVLGVNEWSESAGTITSRGMPNNGNFAVADPRFEAHPKSVQLGVQDWGNTGPTVTGQMWPGQGPFAIADPRFDAGANDYGQYGLCDWTKSMGAVINVKSPGQGMFAVQDPRIDGMKHNNCFRVVRFDRPGNTVTAGTGPSAGGAAVADPRPPAGPLFSKYAVTKWDQRTGTVIGGDDSGAYAVADPRPPVRTDYKVTKYRVTAMDEPAGAVISASGTGNGAYAIADPRTGFGNNTHHNVLHIVEWSESSKTVTGSNHPSGGAACVADPRTDEADSETINPELPQSFSILPAPDQKLVTRIISLDGTWHRPFTTLELAALQGLIDPQEYLELDGLSDSAWRERIGNAVPPPAAKAIASEMGRTLLLARSGETFVLGDTPIWVRNVAIGLSLSQGEPNA